MTTLTWQTLALLGITYFIGCCLGCLARRAVWRRRMRTAAEVVHQPAATAVGAMAGGAGLAQQTVARVSVAEPAVKVTAPARTTAPEPIREAKPVAERAATSRTESQADRFKEALENGGRAAERMPPAVPALPVTSDDLKRIRAIDASLEARLNSLGVHSFSAIAQWTAADTARISKELGFKGRIERENWIEQAQILARGGDTRYAQRIARGESAAAQPIEDEGEPLTPAQRPTAVAAPVQTVGDKTASGHAASPDVPARAAFAQESTRQVEALPISPPPRPVAGAGRDNLQRIRGINAEIEALLNRQGVTRYAQIASWSNVETGRFDSLLGQAGRIARENWIEQAQILARGGDTAYSREYDRGGTGAAQAAPDAAKPARPVDLAALRSVRSEAYRPADQSPIGSAGRTAGPDDLKRIRGIGLLIEKELNRLGVTSYEHIANWTAADIDRVSRVLDFKGRIERENWVEQARILASGGHTEFSRRVDRTTAPRVG